MLHGVILVYACVHIQRFVADVTKCLHRVYACICVHIERCVADVAKCLRGPACVCMYLYMHGCHGVCILSRLLRMHGVYAYMCIGMHACLGVN
jgi:hypothetical protein